ncbi:hypothetical protein [Variovorax sp. EBFNA2]|uniref:hypothetical protein n=1 Tax=Variovorax sp. EBFNA2 TaxID=3342097 RepID=UPI0029C0E958|nr:hypothetical protein [Variovorax boronicumulans]WPG40598.1 hypothetical protein RZE79_15020 [Variovorax boronicumulans]
MKTLIALTLLGLSAGALAQTTAGGANNQSSSSATTSAQGNTQAVNFNSSAPSDVTTRSTLDSTQNINNTGATTSVVDYRGSYTVKNVPSVSGPNLTTSNDTCMGSSSASANGPGVGLSFGTTWTDEHCKRLKMSRELWNKGMKAASLAMDCMDPQAQAALEMTGSKCPQSMTAEERVSAFGPQASGSGAPVAARPAAPVTPVAAAPVAPAAPVALAPAPAPVAAVQQPAAPATLVEAMPMATPAPQPAPAVEAAQPAPVMVSAVAPVALAPQPDILEARITRRLPADPADEVAAAPADAQ